MLKSKCRLKFEFEKFLLQGASPGLVNAIPIGVLGPNCSMVKNSSKNRISPEKCQCNTGFFGVDCGKCLGPACKKENSSCNYECLHGKCDT